ncbi:MAG: tetratricopeptide repeat protein [bacterium]
MNPKISSFLYVAFAITMVILFVTGLYLFISVHKEEAEKEKEKYDFYETDAALNIKRDCDKGIDSEACLKTGLYYLDGKIVGVNRKKAAKYLLKACNMKNAVGCYQLGKFWQNDAEGHKMGKKARLYFKKACDLGDMEACGIVGK